MLSLVLLAVATIGFAQKPAIITGKIKNFDAVKTHLVTMDAANLMAPTKPLACNSDGTFRLELNLKEPTRMYIIMDDPHTGVMFYVQPGMKADMQISYRTTQEPQGDRIVCDVDYKGDCKDEYNFVQTNSYYNGQTKAIEKYYGKGPVTFREYRDTLRAYINAEEAKFANVGGKVFRDYMMKDYESKFPNGLSWFIELSNGTHDKDFDSYIKTTPYQTDRQAASVYANYYKKFMVPAGVDPVVNLLNNVNNIFTDKAIANAIAEEYTISIMAKAPKNIEDIYKAYVAVVGEPSQAVKAAYELNKNNVQGKAGVDFTMKDINGKEVKFSDFKGKAIYFDMWATWCGPCIQQIPYMEKLAEHYKNSNKVQIISVSLDEKVELWKKKLAHDKPQWSQYIMPENFNSELCKTYSISGIPRFMMFDKDGNVISIDAPRPSSPDIISWIDGNLK